MRTPHTLVLDNTPKGSALAHFSNTSDPGSRTATDMSLDGGVAILTGATKGGGGSFPEHTWRQPFEARGSRRAKRVNAWASQLLHTAFGLSTSPIFRAVLATSR